MKPSFHTLTASPGTDPRNHKILCSCGWGHSNTFRACAIRGALHVAVFKHVGVAWNDPERKTAMPLMEKAFSVGEN